MINVSYTNARGETVILDDTERTFLGELYGREGCEAPSLDYVEVTYADGSTEILAVNIKPRDVTLYFWIPTRKPHHRALLDEIKQKLIQTGPKGTSWGELMIRRPDGRPVYLSSVYTGGLDEVIREYPNITKAALTFHAEDALFHDNFETVWYMRQGMDYLYFQPADDLLMTDDLYMRTAAGTIEDTLTIDGERVYPTITITGPAANMVLTNETTGRMIALDASVSLEPGEYITIITDRMKKRSITKVSGTTKTNLLNKLTAGSSLNFWLSRGLNTLAFTNTATTPQSSVELRYKERYLSAE